VRLRVVVCRTLGITEFNDINYEGSTHRENTRLGRGHEKKNKALFCKHVAKHFRSAIAMGVIVAWFVSLSVHLSHSPTLLKAIRRNEMPCI